MEELFNDIEEFNDTETHFEEQLEEERIRLRAIVEEEFKVSPGKFTQGQTDWMLNNYPYGTREQQNTAQQAEEDKRTQKEIKIDNETELRLGKSRAILDGLLYGDNGRQYYVDKFAEQKKEQESNTEKTAQYYKDKANEKREQDAPLKNEFNINHDRPFHAEYKNLGEVETQIGDVKPEVRSNVDSRLVYDSDLEASNSDNGQGGNQGDPSLPLVFKNAAAEERFRRNLSSEYNDQSEDNDGMDI